MMPSIYVRRPYRRDGVSDLPPDMVQCRSACLVEYITNVTPESGEAGIPGAGRGRRRGSPLGRKWRETSRDSQHSVEQAHHVSTIASLPMLRRTEDSCDPICVRLLGYVGG